MSVTPEFVINDVVPWFELDVASGRWTCSPAMLVMYGIPGDQVATTEVLVERLVPQDREPMLARLWHHATHPGYFLYEFRIRGHADRIRHLVLVGHSEDSGGQVKRMSGYLVDISESLNLGAEAAVLASAENRAVIEQCKGILMAGFGVSDDAAFGLLRKCSNEHNIRLSEVAHRVVALTNRPSFHDRAAADLSRVLTHWV